MCSREKETRQLLGGLTVIAANAGGAWSPIGDVTTTMLWMGGQITSAPLIANVFLPSLACLLGAMGWQLLTIDGPQQMESRAPSKGQPPRGSSLVTAVGLGGLLFVPVFKSVTGLPPFAGMLLSTATLWALTDRLHGEDRPKLRMTEALRRIDVAGSLFFLGVLLGVAALETSGSLAQLAQLLANLVPSETLVATLIGAFSAVIDNVPLVAGAMGMYDLTAYPPDAPFWDLIAFCAGTGGSMLIIGSAAGIAYMGIEEVSFGCVFPVSSRALASVYQCVRWCVRGCVRGWVRAYIVVLLPVPRSP
jgi:Na+/H+ antiporter NhaD/arsenite permease-like protein